MEDQLIKAVAYDGQVRLSSLVATHMGSGRLPKTRYLVNSECCFGEKSHGRRFISFRYKR